MICPFIQRRHVPNLDKPQSPVHLSMRLLSAAIELISFSYQNHFFLREVPQLLASLSTFGIIQSLCKQFTPQRDLITTSTDLRINSYHIATDRESLFGMY